MMESSTSELGKDVHIPLCDKERCKEWLHRLSKALQDRHLTCVTDYKITGTYARWFQEAFENCPWTIIHRCRDLWKKINQFEPQLSAEDTKIMVIDLSRNATTRNEDMPRNINAFRSFFSNYSMTAIIDEKSLSTFVLKVVQHFAEVVDRTRLMPDIISHGSQEQGHDQEHLSVKTVEKFEYYPDLFGLNSVSVRESCMKCTEKETAKFSDSKLHQWSEWSESLHKARESYTPHSKFIIHKAIPALFKGKKVNELAFIASCSDSVLQEEAIILLEVLLLSKNDNQREFTLSARILLESLLFKGLVDLYHPEDQDKSVSELIQRLSILYMLAVSDMIMSCRDRAEMQMCDVHLRTVLFRKEICTQLSVFLQDISKKECFLMKKTVRKYIETDNSKLGKSLFKENTAIQACVIVETMKQIFKSPNVKKLELLYVYANCKQNKTPACMTLLIVCLTNFLSFGLKKMKHQDLDAISFEALKIINLQLTRTLTEDMYRFMQILLFDCTFIIQKEIFTCSKYVESDTKKSYEKDQLTFLLNQLERLLSPLLLIEVTLKDKPNDVPEGTWQLFKGKFDSKDVLLRVHCPNVKSHRERNEAGCNVLEDMFCNEMRMLQKLQHENIIKMFAFQESNIPLFYIVEDHSQNNLQVALKNKRQNKDLFKLSTLLKFLIDTVAALEYCHSKLHVHCNLTAESLFSTNDTSVKLCGFHLCLELIDGRGKMDEKQIGEAPIRWTAPESLNDKEYTTASDIWMFGHLMYEVLTHGQLPYPHNKDAEELSKKIRDGKISLPEEPYFKREHYRLISECTAFKPKSRPCLFEIKEQIQGFYTMSTNTEKPQTVAYSYVSDHKPSTEIEKGIPDVNNSRYFEDQATCEGLEQIAISDTIMRFTLKDKYIFREKIVHSVTQDMAIKVEDGKLNDILSGVSICQNRGEVHHIEICIPKSCQGSLLDLAFTNALGTSLKPYIYCLLQVAHILKKLHERSLILGDMCASNLYVEHLDEGLKVYVVSLQYLLPFEMRVTLESNHICARAAPEVIGGGMFSPESDVYCFGYLIWEVLTALDHLYDNLELFKIHMESTHSTPAEEKKKKLQGMWEDTHGKPNCCPDSLFDLIKLCVETASTRRITLDKVIEKIQSILLDLDCNDCLTQGSEQTTA